MHGLLSSWTTMALPQMRAVVPVNGQYILRDGWLVRAKSITQNPIKEALP